MKTIRVATLDEKEFFKSHFLRYLKELSQFDPTIEFNKRGEPIYKWLDYYWKEKQRHPLMFFVDSEFAGLAMVRELEPAHHEIAEFYVAPEFRGEGNAEEFATKVVELFGGKFSFSTRKENRRAVKFWNKFVAKFPSSGCEDTIDCKNWHIQTEPTKDFD